MSLAEAKLLQTSLFTTAREQSGRISLRSRRLVPEIMDDPNLLVAEHHEALKGLARTNCWGTTRNHIWRALNTIARRRGLNTLRILDVACGAGDLVIWLKQQATQRGLNWLVEGCDKSPIAVNYAAKRAADAGLRSMRFFCHDAFEPLPSQTYDVVLSTLFLHHLAEEDAINVLRNMATATKNALLVDDLRRSSLGYALARLASAILTKSPVVKVDAPLSVQAAFSETEVLSLFARADLLGARLSRHWPQRYLITWEKT